MNRFAAPVVRLFGIGLLVLAAVVTGGCATNPVTKKSEISFISEKQEIKIGGQQYLHTQQSAGGKFILDPALNAYVNEVGQKLVKVSDRPNLPFEFVVINDSVPNAWALPGGKLAINRGLLTELKSEAELAAVLSHEVVHAAARHGAKSAEQGTLLAAGAALIGALASDRKNSGLIEFAAQGGAALVGLRFSRENELEADHYGIDYMVRAGYDPKAAVELQETFVRLSGNKSPNWLAGMFATHPPSQERVDANRKKAAALPANLYRGEEVYRQKIAFLVQSKPAYAAHDEGRKLLDEGAGAGAGQGGAGDQAGTARGDLPRAARRCAEETGPRMAEAEMEYGEAIKRNGEYFAFYLDRGLVRQRLGNSAGAQSDLERSNGLLPTAAAHYVLGRLAQDGGHRLHRHRVAGADFSALVLEHDEAVGIGHRAQHAGALGAGGAHAPFAVFVARGCRAGIRCGPGLSSSAP
jgi:hypothetical protein